MYRQLPSELRLRIRVAAPAVTVNLTGNHPVDAPTTVPLFYCKTYSKHF
jgi:hypothetical protein